MLSDFSMKEIRFFLLSIREMYWKNRAIRQNKWDPKNLERNRPRYQKIAIQAVETSRANNIIKETNICRTDSEDLQVTNGLQKITKSIISYILTR